MSEPMIVMRAGADGARMPMVQQPHKDWWTAEKRARFLDHLAQTCNIAASLRAVGVKRSTSLYQLRRRDAQFRAGWDEALALGYARLEAALLDRALNGKRVQAERAGAVIETVEISDTLGLNLLAQHRRAVAEYRAATAGMTPREDVGKVRARIVEQIMAVVGALRDRDADTAIT